MASVVADYSKNRVEKEIFLHFNKREVCFGNRQKCFGNGDGDEIGNLCCSTSHYKKYSFLVLGREMSNLLEMLYWSKISSIKLCF